MKNKEIMKQITYLTHRPDWFNDPKLVRKVQKLGKKIMDSSPKGRTKKMIAMYKNDQLIAKGYSLELVQKAGLSAATIRNYARMQRKDEQGRKYVYLEDET